MVHLGCKLWNFRVWDSYLGSEQISQDVSSPRLMKVQWLHVQVLASKSIASDPEAPALAEAPPLG